MAMNTRKKHLCSIFLQYVRCISNKHSDMKIYPDPFKITSDMIGPVDPVSNLRRIVFRQSREETLLERKYREKRAEVQEWNQTFWSNHNANFFQEKEEYTKLNMNADQQALTPDEMSVFYKAFLDKNWKSHVEYNKKCEVTAAKRSESSTMPCESCAIQFSVFRRKRACVECDRYYCSACLRRGGGTMCAACRVLTTRPLTRHSLAHLKIKDLQYFLHRQNISTRGCVEKEDLVSLVMSHVGSAAPRRRPQTRPAPDFTQSFSSSIKGFTNNINSLINSAFDIRPPTARAHPSPHPGCYSNQRGAAATSAASARPAPTPAAAPHTPAASSTPQGTTHYIPPQNRVPEVLVSEPAEDTTELRDTADCLEIEDLDDAAEWEFVNQPADPLPNDSNVLFAENSDDLPGASALNVRAASELNLNRSESADTVTDTSSLKDEPFNHCEESLPKRIRLEDLETLGDLDNLNPKQLKELLALNRVDFKGCVERTELLERAKRLWRESMRSREELSSLSFEDACKICMDAPVECVLLECGHMAACTACSKRLSECPICRQYVVRAVRVFKS